MFVNGVNCDIYIGTEAGKKLLEDIQSATSSVKVASPYLSASLIHDLIEMKNRNVAVELITEDTIEDFRNNLNIKKLIIQHRETDQNAVAKRDKMSKITVILLVSAFVMLFLFLVLVFRSQDSIVYLGIVPVIAVFLIYFQYRNMVRNTVIYKYRYTSLFPLKVFSHRKKNLAGGTAVDSSPSIHSKIYLIDDRIAYLGSLNFTVSGTQHNYETRIRTEDSAAVKAIRQEYDRLINDSEYAQKEIQAWGKEVYLEAIN